VVVVVEVEVVSVELVSVEVADDGETPFTEP
jgi:hypothetical protein